MNQPVCPHCSTPLTKAPQRKTSCKCCGQDIYVRTHPVDRSKVLTTQQGASEIDTMWLAQRRERVLLDQYGAGLDAERTLLTMQHGTSPNDREVLWILMLKERQKHSGSKQWGLYRNVTLDLADLLALDGKHSDAVSQLIDVCCIDIWLDAQLSRQTSSRFHPTDSLAPGVVERLATCVSVASIPFDELASLVGERQSKLHMLTRWSLTNEIQFEEIARAVFAS